MGFAPENTLIVAGINEFKSSFCAILFHCFSHQMQAVFPVPQVLETQPAVGHQLQRELEFALVADQR